MIPGQNLLNMAFRLISPQTVIYYHDAGRILNVSGQDVTQYGPGIPMWGSFQPVPRKLYQVYGLDLQKEYYTFYTSNNILDVERDLSGDQIAYNGQRYQCESDNDWFTMDGWKGVLCIRLGLDTAVNTIWGFGTKPSNGNQNFNNGNFAQSDE